MQLPVAMIASMGDSSASSVVAVVGSLAAQIVGYFAVVGAVFVVFWVWGERVFARRRVQKTKRFAPKQLRHELGYTVVTFVAGTGSVVAAMALRAKGMTSLVEGAVSPLTTLAWVVGIVAFNDLWFYGWHRALHTRWLYRHVHSVHHKSVDVNPFSSYSFHAFESFILGAWVVPAAVLLPMPMSALAGVQIVGLLNNVNSHLGYELLPAWWVRAPVLAWSASSTYHNLHHQKLHGNYGLFSRVWDRLFGTELPGYESAFTDRRWPTHLPE
jgi:sterol desaturase/sphingolipid hydroxylase (fatty acid hydroxylase superfamily)